MLVYKCLNEPTPGYLQDIFEFSGTDHNYNLRNLGINLKVPKPNTKLFHFVVQVQQFGITCQYK